MAGRIRRTGIAAARTLAACAALLALALPASAAWEPVDGPCRVKLRTGRVLEAAALVAADEAGAFWRVDLPGGGSVVLPVRELRAVERLRSAPAAPEVATVAPPPAAPPPEDGLAAATCDPTASERVARWNGLTEAAAARHGVDLALVRAILAVESCGNPDAVSPKGALGLMQLMPATARDYGCRNPKDPESNIDTGVRHLARLLQKLEGNVELVVAAYNAGEGAVAKAGGVPKFKETRNYVKSVKRHLQRMKPVAAM